MEQTFGRYRLLERLGEGGMAEVYKAKSYGVEGFEKVLVIKRILPKLAAHERFVQMFVHEAKLAVRLSHANIVQVFDLGRVEHRGGEPTSYYIAMEYVPGCDLATLLGRARRTKTPLPIGLAVFVAAEVAKALDHAHRRRDEQARSLGIVHRDISPQNVLLSWEGEVKVTDFGIAKARDSLDEDEMSEARLGRVRGKLAYMSPEQARGERLDGRSDLFALGTMVYEMLTGSNPFAAPTAFETMRRVQAAEYPPIELARPEVPKPLVDIVAQLLQERREDRIRDAGQLYEQLLGYVYAAGERFGARDLADLLAPLRQTPIVSELEVGDVFEEEPTGANERTPVEVPSTRGRPGGSGSFETSRARQDTGSLRTSDLGERREVTALVLWFPSLRTPTASGISDVGESVPAIERASDMLARYGARVLEKEQAQITAIFGLGDADGRDTEAAVRAALVILRAVSGAGPVSAGVDIARILVDVHGVPIRDERLGSLVASAQALARATEGRLAVSPLAGRIVRNAFAIQELPGGDRSAPTQACVVVSARPPAAVYGRFVGRHDELRKLGQLLAQATRRRVQLITIHGDKGIGKTRVLAEMERRLAKGNYNIGFYTASCPKNGGEVPWSGLTAMLQVLCGVHDGDDPERIQRVVPRLRALGLQDDESSAVLALFGANVIDDTKPPASDLGGTLRSAFARMVHGLSEDRLHVFAWDDAQTMDPATLEAVRSIAERSAIRAVFLVATRDAPPPAFASLRNHHAVSLGELSEEDSSRLLATRVGARMLPPELLAFCRERAGGHPLFLEELVKELVDSGAVSVLSGAVRARLDGAVAVPRTLRNLLVARVSRLEPESREVLQAAAILGDPVPIEVLAALLDKKLGQLDRTIASLAARDLLRATGAAQVGFASPMLGEVVLDAIPPEARRELHAAAAAAYAAVVGEEAPEHAERIAEHLYQAGNRDRAATLFARAGLHKILLGHLEPAARLIIRALDLCDYEQRAPDELVDWMAVMADTAVRVRSVPDLPAVGARTLRRVDAAGSLEQKVRVRVDLARALGAVNLFDEAYPHLESAYALAGERDDLRRKALTAEIEMAVRSGDFSKAVRASEKLDPSGPIDEPRVLLALAMAHAAMGEGKAALRDIDRAEALTAPDDLAAASEREKQRVLTYIYLRDFEKAVEASARAVELARSARLRFETAASLHNLGDATRRLGDLPRAYASLTESKEIAEAAGHERLVSINRAHLAFLDGMKGSDAAEPLLRDLIRYSEARGFWTDALEARCLLGTLLGERGSKDAARQELEDVLRMAKAYGNNLVAIDAREALEELD